MAVFHEVQYLRRWWLTLLVGVPAVVVVYRLVERLLVGGPRPGPREIAVVMLVTGIFCWLHWVHLDTLLEDDRLILRYRGLWPAFRIALADIQSVRDVTYRPLLDFGGWGVRWKLDGSRIFSAYGDRAVEIIRGNGKRIFVGSQKATELAAALQQRLKAA